MLAAPPDTVQSENAQDTRGSGAVIEVRGANESQASRSGEKRMGLKRGEAALGGGPPLSVTTSGGV